MSRVAQGLNFSLFRNNLVEISKAKEEKEEKSSVNNGIVKSIIERNGDSLDKDDLNAIISLIKNIKDVKGEIDNEGYVTCYYALSKYNRNSYNKEGTVGAGSDKVMFSTRNSEDLKKFGDTILKLKIPIEKLFFTASTKKEILLKIPFRSSNRKLNIKKYVIK